MPDEFSPSLATIFSPPDGMRGDFGWMCGYSADADFMEEAVMCFSGRARSQRMQEGRIFLALMLDRGNAQITCCGVRHLALRETNGFRLMHAKVALLLFRGESGDDHTLRLIVSTGNWTRQTMRESLDLFWYVDLPLTEARNLAQERADCLAAWDFLRYLRDLCEPCPPAGNKYSATAEARDRFEKKLAALAAPRPHPNPRFMDNRNTPFLEQLVPRIVALDQKSLRRNYLAMGSGFFEGETNGQPPYVLMSIETKLRKAGLLTQDTEIDIVVDPGSCQGLASAWEAMRENGWIIRAAATPESLFGPGARKLHAKFLFSANCQSTLCTRPWVYLGSGNLTGPGFTLGLPAGNLEAGVLFKPGKMFWERQNGTCVSDLLPVFWADETIINGPQALNPGDGFEERPPTFFAAPASLFIWKRESEAQLEAQEAPEATGTREIYEVFSLDAPATPLRELKPGVFAWKGDKPVEVEIRWQGKRARVQVMDEYGRIGASDLKPVRALASAWPLLAEFSSYPEETDEPPTNPPEDGCQGGEPDEGPFGRVRPVAQSRYSVRSMMELLEQIAEKQTDLHETDWALWCSRLEMALVQAADCPEAEFFRAWKINPFTPLRAACFGPDFALEGAARERYQKALDKAEEAWKVRGFDGLDAD